MKNFLCLLLAVITLLLNSNVTYALTEGFIQKDSSNKVEIPKGTIVPISVFSPANSDRLYSGDIIPIIVTEDIFIDGVKVFAEGTKGTADVEKVIRSGSHGRAGFIEIKNAKIKDVYGVNHKVQINIVEKGECRRPSAIFLSVIGVLLILIPFGIWREGDPAYISGNKIFNAVVL